MSLDMLKPEEGVESQDQDKLPQKGGFTLKTGIHDMIVDVAYLEKSAKGATCVCLNLKKTDGSKTVYKHKIYITTGDKKHNRYYFTTKEGKKVELAGYALGNLVSQITAGKDLRDLTSEKKMVKVWDFEASEEKAKEFPVLTELNGKKLRVGMLEVRDNKMVHLGGGKFKKIAKDRNFNEISKVFHIDGMTVAEKKADATAPEFIKTWMGEYPDGKVDDRYTPIDDEDSLPDDEDDDTDTGAVDDIFE